jgi:AcrR family transcriptional regulator
VSPSDRQGRRHSETRDEILRAARALVVDKGAGNLTVRELARRVELASQDLEHLSKHMLAVPDGMPVDERLIEIGLAYVQFAREHPAELNLLFDSLGALAGEDGSLEMLTPTPLFQTITGVLRAGVDQGLFHAREDDDVMLMWHGAWALVHGIATVERTHQHHDELFRARARDVLRVFVNGLKTDWTSG